MKTLLCLFVFSLLPVFAFASPFLVCDPQAGVEYYIVSGLPAPIDGTHVVAQTDGSLRLDLATLTAGGPYSVTAKACKDLWGVQRRLGPFRLFSTCYVGRSGSFATVTIEAY